MGRRTYRMCTPKPCQSEIEDREDFKGCYIPTLGDTSWEAPAALLYAYLEVPRAMSDMILWGRAEGRGFNKVFTKNLIAYLSCMERIDFDANLGVWRRN